MNEPLVLLPGMMCDQRLFTHQTAALGNDRDVIVMDTCGHNSMAALAKDILLKAPAQFALGGLSMGGILAMEVFRQAPARVTRLALMDTNPKAENDDVKASRQTHLERTANGDMLGVMRDVMIPNYIHRDIPRPDIEALCLSMASDLGETCFINQSLALRNRPDQQETLKHVRIPTMILMGEDDQLCPRDRHDTMKSLIPHADLIIIPFAGHLPTLEQPEATTHALSAWLKR
ncbi:alpha/beta fold hydrolase [Grimontia hollisae]|uniref:Pimelyl-[acyl-carrier protein] methyl ester esterase n=1 Tax=Grimontia hollisae TaxID=673 RepID=A0A377J803_GRIHO|nr:alpha/beta fold hydrolase [Grimontia hollisae]STO98429.1 Pimelyl-[acyl-carrier protein] methyl ester esterase [Grimontia hollisae]